MVSSPIVCYRIHCLEFASKERKKSNQVGEENSFPFSLAGKAQEKQASQRPPHPWHLHWCYIYVPVTSSVIGSQTNFLL